MSFLMAFSFQDIDYQLAEMTFREKALLFFRFFWNKYTLKYKIWPNPKSMDKLLLPLKKLIKTRYNTSILLLLFFTGFRTTLRAQTRLNISGMALRYARSPQRLHCSLYALKCRSKLSDDRGFNNWFWTKI